MSCDCKVKFHTADHTAEELGPAYKYYKDGAHIPQLWEADLSPYDFFGISSCCGAKSEYDLGQEYVAHYVMLAAFDLIALSLLAAFYCYKDVQPFKFRDVRVIAIFVVAVICQMHIDVFTLTMGGTISVGVAMVGSVVLAPLILWYYVLKGAQLLYIQKWNELKSQYRDLKSLAFFKKYKFVLTYRFFVYGFLSLLAVQLIFYATLFSRPIFMNPLKAGGNALTTVRCAWWSIPEQYRMVNASSSTYCPCISAAEGISGAEDSCTLALELGFVQCLEGTEDAITSSMCSSCTDTASCEVWLTEYFKAGHCGWFDKVPVVSSCVFGILADKPVASVLVAEMFLLILLNTAILIPMLLKTDEFGMIQENSLLLLGYGVVLGLWETGIVDSKFYNSWTYLLPSYSMTYMLLFIWCWWCMLLTLGYAFIRYLFFKYRRHKRRVKDQRRRSTHAAQKGRMAISEGSTVSTQDELDLEVDFCISHLKLLEDYKRFALKEFTVENPCFLGEAQELITCCESKLRSATHEDVLYIESKARAVVEKYIVSSAPLEINIPFKMKQQIANVLDSQLMARSNNSEYVQESQPVRSRSDSNPDGRSRYDSNADNPSGVIDTFVNDEYSVDDNVPTPVSPVKNMLLSISSHLRLKAKLLDNVEDVQENNVSANTRITEIADSFRPAVLEIKKLVVRDSWPRYRDSPAFEKFTSHYAAERGLTIKMSNFMSSNKKSPTHADDLHSKRPRGIGLLIPRQLSGDSLSADSPVSNGSKSSPTMAILRKSSKLGDAASSNGRPVSAKSTAKMPSTSQTSPNSGFNMVAIIPRVVIKVPEEQV